jgi:hypothetical protein
MSSTASSLTKIGEEIDEFTTLVSTRLVTLSSQLVRTKSDLSKRSREIDIINEKMSKISKDMESKIELNVGGTVFTTTLSVLTSEKDSFFTAMFSEQFQTKPDEKGQYFIDRDPALFKYIIRYLRNRTVDPNWKKLVLQDRLTEMLDEIEYYQIRSLRPLIELALPKIDISGMTAEHVKVEILGARATVKIPRDQETWVTVLFEACTRWRINILHLPGSDHNQDHNMEARDSSPVSSDEETNQPSETILIGVCEPSTFQSDVTNDRNYGAFYVNNIGGRTCDSYDNQKWGSPEFKMGDVIDFECDGGKLNMAINGKHFGTAYTEIPKSCTPAIELQSYVIPNASEKSIPYIEFIKLE